MIYENCSQRTTNQRLSKCCQQQRSGLSSPTSPAHPSLFRTTKRERLKIPNINYKSILLKAFFFLFWGKRLTNHWTIHSSIHPLAIHNPTLQGSTTLSIHFYLNMNLFSCDWYPCFNDYLFALAWLFSFIIH